MDAQTRAEELIQMVTQSMHAMVQAHAEQVTRGEGALLSYLATKHDGASAGELREALEVGSGRVSNALKNLENKGLVMRVPSARDGRVVLVYLTEQGRTVITAKYERLLRRVSELLEDIGEDDSAELLRLTRKVIDQSQKQREESVDSFREPRCSQSGGINDR
ncbi:MAG: winged helix DNA-binding protein [Clostridiales bacterium]|nr:winged helix DNA-binding protein [Clostridiales bacterium]